MSGDEDVVAVKNTEETTDDSGLDLGELKKKKKKPKKDRFAELEEDKAPEPADEAAGELADLDLSGLKKKKKKKAKKEGERRFDDEMADDDAADAAVENGDESIKAVGRFAWSGSDRDYKYEELLDRVYGILRENNPELTGEKKRVLLKPPEVAREGTKKTVFVNFMDLCKMMNRQPEHVQTFLLAELGTSGSLDGQSRLIVKGRFQPKSFEQNLRKYINEYVMCHACKSVDTLLDRDSATRLMHLRCQQCGASRTVQAIKAGFVARVTKRKAEAAK